VLLPTLITTIHTGQSEHIELSAGLVTGLVIFGVLALLAPVFYLSIGDGTKRGQTVGKLAMGIAVHDSHGNTVIGFWRGLGRTCFNVVLGLPFEIPLLVGNLAPLWDRRRQSWADHVVHSIVVDLRP